MPDRPQLLSLGSIAADFQAQLAEPVGQSETVRPLRVVRFSGGKAANVACFARRLGHPAVLLGRVGSDDLARQALDPLVAAGVDVASVRHLSGPTAVSLILVPPDGKKRIVASPGVAAEADAQDQAAVLRRVAAAPAGSVLVADYEVAPALVSAAVAAAHRRGLRVVVDPAPPGLVPLSDMDCIDALTPNAGEAAALARVPSGGPAAPLAAARVLAGHAVRAVCVKLDDGGCIVLAGGQAWQLHPAPARLVDSTGAGDAFTAAFAVALLEGADPLEAARHGVAASEIAVSVFGSQPAYPDRSALQARLALARRVERLPPGSG